MKLLKIILFVFLSTIVYSQEFDYRFMTNKIVFKKGKNTGDKKKVVITGSIGLVGSFLAEIK